MLWLQRGGLDSSAPAKPRKTSSQWEATKDAKQSKLLKKVAQLTIKSWTGQNYQDGAQATKESICWTVDGWTAKREGSLPVADVAKAQESCQDGGQAARGRQVADGQQGDCRLQGDGGALRLQQMLQWSPGEELLVLS